MVFKLTKANALLIIGLVWVAIYLPSLGAPQFKGEEARRVLPAIQMLESGNWIVPFIGAREYHSKPPGINWIIAASFLITGQISEFTARLPSVLFVLTFAVLLILLPHSWLSLTARLIAALVFLTSVGVMETGRMSEIEAIYTVMTGMATLWWLNTWLNNGSKWLLWLVPSIVIAYGLLVKGPFIAMFFYITVFMVLLYDKKLKELLVLPHIVGILIMAALGLGWLYLASCHATKPGMAGQMTGQLLGHTILHTFRPIPLIVRILKALVNLLPWVLFLPVLWDKNIISRIAPEQRNIFKSCRKALVICFVLMNLMPGAVGRYSLPLVPLAACLLGWSLSLHEDFVLSDRIWKNLLLGCFLVMALASIVSLFAIKADLSAFAVASVAAFATLFAFFKRTLLRNVVSLSVATAVAAAIGMLLYAVFAMVFIIRYEADRPGACTVNRIVPQSDTIYLFDTRYQTFYFYIRPPFKYLLSEDQVDKDVHYLVLEERILNDLIANHQLSFRSPKILYEFPEEIPTRYRLVRLD